MFLRLLICLFTLAPMILPLEAGIMDLISRAFSKEAPPQPPSIRVLLAHDETGVFLEVKGKYHIYDPHTNAHINTSNQGKRRLVEATFDGIRWGEEFPGVFQIAIVPDSPDTTILVDGVEYRGKMYVYDVEGAISIVNQVDLEDYLSSILPQRYSQEFPEEVYGAIAITARTDNYFTTKNSKNPFWDVEAQKVGYHGYALSRISKPLNKGLQETRYLVLHRVGKGEWLQTPFSVSWKPEKGVKLEKGTTYSLITLDEASNLAKKGAKAMQILEKAFPDTSIQRIYEPAT